MQRGEAAPCHKGMGPKLNFDIETSKKGCSNTSNELLLTEKSLANLIKSMQTLKRRLSTKERLVARQSGLKWKP